MLLKMLGGIDMEKHEYIENTVSKLSEIDIEKDYEFCLKWYDKFYFAGIVPTAYDDFLFDMIKASVDSNLSMDVILDACTGNEQHKSTMFGENLKDVIDSEFSRSVGTYKLLEHSNKRRYNRKGKDKKYF